MTPTRPKHLYRETTRHGRIVWYVRVGAGPRTRLRTEYDSAEFWQEYAETLAGVTKSPRKARLGTLAWLADQYRQTTGWSSLRPATRRQRENILRRVLAKAGHEPFEDIDAGSIRDVMDSKRETPAAARNFLETMRGLFRWAMEAQHVETDPTDGIKVRRTKTEGFRPWADWELAKFEGHWPVGTRERLAFDLLIYTGLRRGDAARVGRQHTRDGALTIDTEKTGQRVTLPILEPLARSIAACPAPGLAFISQADGTPMTKESFGNWFRQAVKAAGLDGVSAHGLRKSAATKAAENGATVAELEALFGWRGGGMASLYTREADRARLAKAAAHKLARGPDSERKIPAPENQIPAPRKKGR